MPRLVLLVWLFAHAVSPAQDRPGSETPAEPARLTVKRPGDAVVLSTDDRQVTVAELARRWHETTGRTFVFGGRGVEGMHVLLTGQVQAAYVDADFLFEAILVRSGCALIPSGPPGSKLFSIESLDQGKFLRQTATFVPAPKTAELDRMPAQIFTTVFVVKAPPEVFRNALQQTLSQRQVELVTELSPTGGIVVTALGPTLAAVARVLAEADRGAAAEKTEVFALKYAVASEIAATILSVVSTAPKGGVQHMGPNGPVPTPVEPETRIVADVRTNSIVVSASAAKFDTIVALIRALDREVPAK